MQPHENPPQHRGICCNEDLQDSNHSPLLLEAWILITRTPSCQVSDGYFRIYDLTADIRLKSTLESFELSLLLSTTHYSENSWVAKHDLLQTPNTLIHHIRNSFQYSHSQNILGCLPTSLIQLRNDLPLKTFLYALWRVHFILSSYTVGNVVFTFWTDMQPEGSTHTHVAMFGRWLQTLLLSTWASKQVHTECANLREFFNLNKSLFHHLPTGNDNGSDLLDCCYNEIR